MSDEERLNAVVDEMRRLYLKLDLYYHRRLSDIEYQMAQDRVWALEQERKRLEGRDRALSLVEERRRVEKEATSGCDFSEEEDR